NSEKPWYSSTATSMICRFCDDEVIVFSSEIEFIVQYYVYGFYRLTLKLTCHLGILALSRFVVLPSPCGPVQIGWSGAEIEAPNPRNCPPRRQGGPSLVNNIEETTMGGVPGLNSSTGSAGSGGVDLSQLQQFEQQATQDVLAISANQIDFNTKM